MGEWLPVRKRGCEAAGRSPEHLPQVGQGRGIKGLVNEVYFVDQQQYVFCFLGKSWTLCIFNKNNVILRRIFSTSAQL